MSHMSLLFDSCCTSEYHLKMLSAHTFAPIHHTLEKGIFLPSFPFLHCSNFSLKTRNSVCRGWDAQSKLLNQNWNLRGKKLRN